MKFVTADDAISEIRDGWTLVPGGFGSCDHPDALTATLRARFLTTGRPRGLSYLFAAGPGDKAGAGQLAFTKTGPIQAAYGRSRSVDSILPFSFFFLLLLLSVVMRLNAKKHGRA